MNPSEYQRVTSQLIRRTVLVIMAWITPFAPLAGVFAGLSLGLSPDDTVWAVTRILPPVFLAGGVLLPWALVTLIIRGGLRTVEGEAPEERYTRILKMPWKLAAVGANLPYFFGGVFFTTPVALVFGKSLMLVGLGLLVAIAFGIMLSVPMAIRLEQMLMPYALEEQPRLRERPESRGFFWPRLAWYLPYVFGTTLTVTLGLMGMVFSLHAQNLRDSQMAAIRADASIPSAEADLIATKLQGYSDTLLSSVGLPMLLLGIFTLVLPPLAAWMIARRQARAAAAVQEAIEALAAGAPALPRWCSTDEIGDLSMGMMAVLERLKEIPSKLQASADQLHKAGGSLGAASQEQRQSLMQQAAALQEAQVTSQEIRQTSDLAAKKADAVLGVATRAEELGRTGESSIEKTLTGLTSIRQFVEEMRSRVVRVQDSASQITDIAGTVKDLADQSNILAINAAIEAARSGEMGKGFAVVAQEFRSLADQSIRETVRIARIVEKVGASIDELVAMAEQGARQVEGGLEMARSSGDSLRQLAEIVQENSAAARQIASAVSQQNTGISQILTAIAQLNTNMEETVQRVDTTVKASQTLESITQEVSAIAKRYKMSA